jgi:hypothetical protein
VCNYWWKDQSGVFFSTNLLLIYYCYYGSTCITFLIKIKIKISHKIIFDCMGILPILHKVDMPVIEHKSIIKQ